MTTVSSLILKPRERIVRVYRRFPLIDLHKHICAFLLMLVPFFFLFPLLKLQTWGIVLGSTIFLIGFVYFVRNIFLWYHNVFVITTDRIIDFDQRGVFERVVSQSSHDQIQDVSFHIQGVVPTMFRYGDLNIKTGWGSVDLCVPCIYRPARAQRILLDAQEAFMKRTGGGGSPLQRKPSYDEEHAYADET